MTTFTREDFEMAAKAAGYDVRWYGRHFAPEGFRFFGSKNDRLHGTPWNPRDDDGDALRLAVKLQLSISHGSAVDANQDLQGVIAWLGPIDHPTAIAQESCVGAEGVAAATRHAIFCAAIAIGRAMP